MAILYIFMWVTMVMGFARMKAEGAYNMERPGPSNYIVAILRTLIMRYGGLPLYLKLRPFFIGLILGGGAAGVVESIVNIIGAALI